MSRARKLLRSFEGKYPGKMVFCRVFRSSATEDPRIIGQTNDAELFVLRAFPH
jgi:hypothetical protein